MADAEVVACSNPRHRDIVTRAFAEGAKSAEWDALHEEVVSCPGCQQALEQCANLPEGHFVRGGMLADPVLRERLGMRPSEERTEPIRRTVRDPYAYVLHAPPRSRFPRK